MKFRIDATSVWDNSKVIDDYPVLEKFGYEPDGHITINTLEELLELMKLTNNELIILRHWRDNELTIEIYDTYRE